MKTKRCPKCEQELSIAKFGKSRAKKDGLQSSCTGCRSQQRKEYAAQNQVKLMQYQKKYREQNQDRIKQQEKKYRNTVAGHLRCIFSAMKHRCNNPKCKTFKYYGGRGIQNKFKSSDEFVGYVIDELKVDPRGLQIDRINNDGHYEKGNIQFVTCGINNNNRRKRVMA